MEIIWILMIRKAGSSQDLKKAQEFIQFEIDAIEGSRTERKEKPKHEDFMDALLRGLFGGSVGHIEITGKRNGMAVRQDRLR